MKLIRKTPRKHIEEGYIEILSDSNPTVVISRNYKGKLVKLSNDNVEVSFDNTNLKINDYGTLDYRGTGSFEVSSDSNLTYITVNNNPIEVTTSNTLIHWIKTDESEYRFFIEEDFKSKQDKLTLNDSLYFDEEGNLSSNITTFTDTIIHQSSDTNVKALSFRPTEILNVIINNQWVDPLDYIYTAPATLEILGDLDEGDKITIKYNKFVIEPTYD